MTRLKQAWLALCVVGLVGCHIDPCPTFQRGYKRAQEAAAACRGDGNCRMTAAEYEQLLIWRDEASKCKAAQTAEGGNSGE